MDRSDTGVVFKPPDKTFHGDESTAGTIGLITLALKLTGERSAGNPPAGFDVAGVGNVE